MKYTISQMLRGMINSICSAPPPPPLRFLHYPVGQWCVPLPTPSPPLLTQHAGIDLLGGEGCAPPSPGQGVLFFMIKQKI
jgi:hypothetical protein